MRKPSQDLVDRYAGTCQSCMRLQKLHAGELVHHGYQRPGLGYIVGDCRGSGLRPYERTCEDIKGWLVGVVDAIEKTTSRIERIERQQESHRAYRVLPAARRLHYAMQDAAWQLSIPLDRRGKILEHETDVFSPGATVAQRIEEFERLNALALRKAQAWLGQLIGEADELERRIEAWTLRPVITVQEMLLLAERERDPLLSVLPKEAARMGKTLLAGRKPKLYLDPLGQLLSAIGWSLAPATMALKVTSNNVRDLPVLARLISCGVELAPPSGRLSSYQLDSQAPGEVTIMPQTADEAWASRTLAALSSLPAASPKGPEEPYDPRGLYVSSAAEQQSRRGSAGVVARNVWIVVAALRVTSRAGASILIPEVYGVSYDMRALKPAGLYKWAEQQGIQDDLRRILPEGGSSGST